MPNNTYIGFTNAAGSAVRQVLGFNSSDEVRLFGISGVTLNTGSIATERLRIDSTGNLEIGTSSPLYTLDVSGGTRVIGDAGVILRAGRSSINLSSGTTSTTADLQLAAADRIDLFASSLKLTTSSLTAGDMVLQSKGSMTFDTSGGTGKFAFVGGNVGVGITNPLALLHVDNGSTGSVIIGGYNTSTKALTFRNLSSISAAQNFTIQAAQNLFSFIKPTPTSADFSRYDFTVGSLDSVNPFWGGLHLATSDTITEVGVNTFPRVSLYNNYNSTAYPTNLTFNIGLGNSGTLK